MSDGLAVVKGRSRKSLKFMPEISIRSNDVALRKIGHDLVTQPFYRVNLSLTHGGRARHVFQGQIFQQVHESHARSVAGQHDYF